MKKWCV